MLRKVKGLLIATKKGGSRVNRVLLILFSPVSLSIRLYYFPTQVTSELIRAVEGCGERE